MSSRQPTSDPAAEILRTMTPDDLRARLAWYQEHDPALYPEVRATLRDLAHKLAAPANADEVEGGRILQQAAPGLMTAIVALGPELEG